LCSFLKKIFIQIFIMMLRVLWKTYTKIRLSKPSVFQFRGDLSLSKPNGSAAYVSESVKNGERFTFLNFIDWLSSKWVLLDRLQENIFGQQIVFESKLCASCSSSLIIKTVWKILNSNFFISYFREHCRDSPQDMKKIEFLILTWNFVQTKITLRMD
jgi:hypothetical protein